MRDTKRTALRILLAALPCLAAGCGGEWRQAAAAQVDGLSHLVRSVFREDPLSGHLLAFRSRRDDQITIRLDALY
jgi:hypothetical protein